MADLHVLLLLVYFFVFFLEKLADPFDFLDIVLDNEHVALHNLHLAFEVEGAVVYLLSAWLFLDFLHSRGRSIARNRVTFRAVYLSKTLDFIKLPTVLLREELRTHRLLREIVFLLNQKVIGHFPKSLLLLLLVYSEGIRLQGPDGDDGCVGHPPFLLRVMFALGARHILVLFFYFVFDGAFCFLPGKLSFTTRDHFAHLLASTLLHLALAVEVGFFNAETAVRFQAGILTDELLRLAHCHLLLYPFLRYLLV